MTPHTTYFAALAELLGGCMSVETLRGLYVPIDPEAGRLVAESIVRTLEWSHDYVLSTHYPAVRAALDERAWRDVVAGYFAAHPPREHPFRNNAAAFPRFLESYAQRRGLPGWLAEVADLEWREWIATSALDDPADAHDDGPLRCAATLSERIYAHDLVGWLDTDDRPSGDGPARASSIVVVWRDRSLVAQRASIGQREHALVDALRDGVRVAIGATIRALHDLGLVRGSLAAS
jgi:hypothetical protein